MKKEAGMKGKIFMVFKKGDLFSGFEIEDDKINISNYFVIEGDGLVIEGDDYGKFYKYGMLDILYENGDLIQVIEYLKDGVFHKEINPVNNLDLYYVVRDSWNEVKREFKNPKDVDNRLKENIERLKNKEIENKKWAPLEIDQYIKMDKSEEEKPRKVEITGVISRPNPEGINPPHKWTAPSKSGEVYLFRISCVNDVNNVFPLSPSGNGQFKDIQFYFQSSLYTLCDIKLIQDNGNYKYDIYCDYYDVEP